MAKVNVDFTVTPSSGVLGYWIAVDDQDVTLVNGKGSISLEAGQEAILVWWFVGSPGKSISIVGKEGNREVVEVKKSTIPPGRTRGSGFKRFTP